MISLLDYRPEQRDELKSEWKELGSEKKVQKPEIKHISGEEKEIYKLSVAEHLLSRRETEIQKKHLSLPSTSELLKIGVKISIEEFTKKLINFKEKIKNMKEILEKPYHGKIFTEEDLREIKEFVENPAYVFQREISKEEIEEALRRDVEIKAQKLVEMNKFKEILVEEALEEISPGDLGSYVKAAGKLLLHLKLSELWRKWEKDPEYKERDLLRDYVATAMEIGLALGRYERRDICSLKEASRSY